MRKRQRIAQGPSPTREILAYLAEHPQAQDSLDGIMQWWLLDRAINQWSAQVRTALASLIADGLVLERKVLGGNPLYRLNDQRLNEVRAMLGANAATGSGRKRSGRVESVYAGYLSKTIRRQEASNEMSMRITNTSRQALVVPLNSGSAIHLAPGETCDPLDEVEITANPKIDKMSGGGLIAVAPVQLAGIVELDDSAGAEAGAQAPRKKKA